MHLTQEELNSRDTEKKLSLVSGLGGQGRKLKLLHTKICIHHISGAWDFIPGAYKIQNNLKKENVLKLNNDFYGINK